MTDNNQNLATAPTPSPEQKSRKSYWGTGLAILFMVVIVITLTSPSQSLSALMSWVDPLTGFVVAAGMINAIMDSVQHRGPLAKFFAFIAAGFVLAIILGISFFTALIGYTRNTPIQGD